MKLGQPSPTANRRDAPPGDRAEVGPPMPSKRTIATADVLAALKDAVRRVEADLAAEGQTTSAWRRGGFTVKVGVQAGAVSR